MSTPPATTNEIDEYEDLTNGRDPAVDHPEELNPELQWNEDVSDVVQAHGDGTRQVIGENVDANGVAHFLLITQDPSEPDTCGGCRKEWPCEGRVALHVSTAPELDPGQVMLQNIAYDAARQALADAQRPE